MFGWFIGRNKGFQPNTLPDLQLWLPADRIGVQGYSLDFDGTDDFVQADNEITDYPFTLECWVRFDVVNASQSVLYLSKTGSSTVYYGFSMASTGKLFIRSRNTTDTITNGNTTISANTWYHLAGVFTSNTERTLYLNGVLEVTQTNNVAFASTSIKVFMGLFRDSSPSAYLNGKMSDVRIWNTARTAQQIADNYNKRLIGNESGLVGYWKLDKGSGTTVADSTTNANAGTITGAVWDNSEPFTEPIDDGTAVRLWSDQSGNGYDATQSTTAARPTFIASGLNGLPVVRFDGTDDRLALGASALGMLRNVGGATFFVVVKYPANSIENVTFFASIGTSVSSSRLTLTQRTNNKLQIGGRRLDADSFQSAETATTITNIFLIHSGILNYANAKAFNYVNGALDGAVDPFQTAGNTTNNDSNNITIGATGTPANYLNGDIGEIIVYNRALNTSELAQVHRYLARKWGIALA